MAEPAQTVEAGLAWGEAVCEGDIPACRWVRLACERQRRELADPGRDMWFDVAAAQHAIDCITSLVHVKGPLAGQNLELQPWQLFQLACLYGWRRWHPDALKIGGIARKDRARWPRRFRKAYLEVARKNGKSTQLAGMGLYGLAGEGEQGAEVYSAATAKDQARIVFGAARQMVKRSPEMGNLLDVFTHSIVQQDTASVFRALAADSDTLDGLNTWLAVVDELHAHKTRDVLEVLESSTGSRLGALIVVITTAGVDIEGICYEERTYLTQILEGTITDDTVWGMIFTAEEFEEHEDLLTDPEIWRLANPNLGVSVSEDDMRAQATKAAEMPGALPQFLRKKLNIWCGAESQWLDVGAWKKGHRPDFELPAGTPGYIGLDLSRTEDLTSWIAVFALPERQCYVTGRTYICKVSLERAPRKARQLFERWIRAGHMVLTEGESLDIEQVGDELLEFAAGHDIAEVDFDPYRATELIERLNEEGLTCVDVGQNVRNLSPAMEFVDHLLAEGDVFHDGNPVLTWALGNVVAHEDKNSNRFPNRSAQWSKIDPARAMLNAMARLANIVPRQATAGAWIG